MYIFSESYTDSPCTNGTPTRCKKLGTQAMVTVLVHLGHPMCVLRASYRLSESPSRTGTATLVLM